MPLGAARKYTLEFLNGGTGVPPVQDRRDACPTCVVFDHLFPRGSLLAHLDGSNHQNLSRFEFQRDLTAFDLNPLLIRL